MSGAFGLLGNPNPSRFPADLIIEANRRIDIWMVLQRGGLAEGATTELAFGSPVGCCRPTDRVNVCRLIREAPNLWINQTRAAVVWDEPMPGVSRPWWECPSCSKKSRYLYLRATIACARCHKLQNACLHVRRQTPGVGRVERLRRRLADCAVRAFAPLPARIRRGRGGRSRAYHDKLVTMIRAEEEALLGHLQTVTRDLERRIAIRKAKGKW